MQFLKRLCDFMRTPWPDPYADVADKLLKTVADQYKAEREAREAAETAGANSYGRPNWARGGHVPDYLDRVRVLRQRREQERRDAYAAKCRVDSPVMMEATLSVFMCIATGYNTRNMNADYYEGIRALDEAGLIYLRPNPYSNETRWRLTTVGKNYLRRLCAVPVNRMPPPNPRKK